MQTESQSDLWRAYGPEPKNAALACVLIPTPDLSATCFFLTMRQGTEPELVPVS